MPLESLHLPGGLQLCNTNPRSQMQLLSQLPPEYWTPRQRYEANLLRTKAFRRRDDLLRRCNGNPTIGALRSLNREYPGGMYWPYTPRWSEVGNIDGGGVGYGVGPGCGMGCGAGTGRRNRDWDGRMWGGDLSGCEGDTGSFSADGGDGGGEARRLPFPPPPRWMEQDEANRYIRRGLRSLAQEVRVVGGSDSSNLGAQSELDGVWKGLECEVRDAVKNVMKESNKGKGSGGEGGCRGCDGRRERDSGDNCGCGSSRRRSRNRKRRDILDDLADELLGLGVRDCGRH